MMRWLFALTLLLPLPALAQNAQSLADVKAELAQLAAQFLTLKQELVSSGAAANGSAGGDALQRLDAIEAALTKLTAKTEEVEFKLNSVVSDGTNRIGDIEFRLCELTEGRDPSTLPVTPDLGALASGAAAPAVPDPAVVSAPETPAAPAATDGVELAVNEKADFDRAKAVLDSGDFLGAADLFKTYAQSYPGGPLVDKYAQTGNPHAFTFPEPQIPDLNFSFSGLKTSILYFINKGVQQNPNFIQEHLEDICASVQQRIVTILLAKLTKAAKLYGISQVAIAGGVSANSGLRKALQDLAEQQNWEVFIPKFEYCTDNAAMIAIAGYYKFLAADFVGQDVAPLARMSF